MRAWARAGSGSSATQVTPYGTVRLVTAPGRTGHRDAAPGLQLAAVSRQPDRGAARPPNRAPSARLGGMLGRWGGWAETTNPFTGSSGPQRYRSPRQDLVYVD